MDSDVFLGLCSLEDVTVDVSVDTVHNRGWLNAVQSDFLLN